MDFLNASRAHGHVPLPLKAAADVRFIGHSADGDSRTLSRFDVPRFGSVAPVVFRQKRLWDEGPEPEQTAFELLGAALVDVAARREDSNRFDPGLLRRSTRYRALFSRGHLTRIGLPDSVAAASARLDTAVAGQLSPTNAASDLSASTPPTQRVRLVGRLDVMGASQGVLKLELKPGVVVSGLWEVDGPVDALKDYFNRDVVIEGCAVYRPSGALLCVDVQAIGLAGHGCRRLLPGAAQRPGTGRRRALGATEARRGVGLCADPASNPGGRKRRRLSRGGRGSELTARWLAPGPTCWTPTQSFCRWPRFAGDRLGLCPIPWHRAQ